MKIRRKYNYRKFNRRNTEWLIARTNECKKRNERIAREYSNLQKKELLQKKIIKILSAKYKRTGRQIYNIIKDIPAPQGCDRLE
jgi:hypothetical protein